MKFKTTIKKDYVYLEIRRPDGNIERVDITHAYPYGVSPHALEKFKRDTKKAGRGDILGVVKEQTSQEVDVDIPDGSEQIDGSSWLAPLGNGNFMVYNIINGVMLVDVVFRQEALSRLKKAGRDDLIKKYFPTEWAQSF
jgi:hypothetical protein